MRGKGLGWAEWVNKRLREKFNLKSHFEYEVTLISTNLKV